MSRTLPTYITPPGLDAYPFITGKLIYTNPNIDPLGDGEPWPDKFEDAGFEIEHFGTPSAVDTYRSSIVMNMTDSTFERLFSILKLCLHKTPITSKTELSRLSLRNSDIYATENFRPGQLEAYLLGDLTIDYDVHWGDLTALYNESSPDQQRVIIDYFQHFKNRSLVRMLSIPAPAFSLPQSLDEQFLSKAENGQTFLFSDIADTWLRDDVFHRQFRIEAVTTDLSNQVVACAPTLFLALGKATAFAQMLNRESLYIGIRVMLDDQRLANAKTAYIRGHLSAVKLIWNLGNLGTGTNLKKISVQEGDMKEIFTDTLLTAERALGVQWSKVQKLEDELGL